VTPPPMTRTVGEEGVGAWRGVGLSEISFPKVTGLNICDFWRVSEFLFGIGEPVALFICVGISSKALSASVNRMGYHDIP
jgi:hypothetical protein